MGDIGAVGAAGIRAAADLAIASATNATNAVIANKTNKTNKDIASETNETNIGIHREDNAFNAEEAQKTRDFQVEQWQRENEYNSPVAQMERFREAGLNGAAILNGQGFQQGNSTPSAPAASSAAAPHLAVPTMVPPHLETPQVGQALANIYAAMTQGDLNLANKGKVDSETDRMKQTLSDYVRSFKSDADRKEIENAWLPLLNESDVKKNFTQVMALYNQALLFANQSETEKAKASLARAQELTEKYNSETAKIVANTTDAKIRAIIREYESSTKKNLAEASEASERAKTIRDTRDAEVRLKEALASHQHTDAFVAAQTMMSKIYTIRNDYRLSEKQREFLDDKIKLLEKDIDAARLDIERKNFDNGYMLFDKVVSTLGYVNSELNKWAPWSFSRDTDISYPNGGKMNIHSRYE